MADKVQAALSATSLQKAGVSSQSKSKEDLASSKGANNKDIKNAQSAPNMNPLEAMMSEED